MSGRFGIQSPRTSVHFEEKEVEEKSLPGAKLQLGKPQLRAPSRRRTSGERTKSRGRTKSHRGRGRRRQPRAKSMLPNLGSVTLRDAADFAGAAIRGGMAIATRILNVEEKMLDLVQAGVAVVQGTPNIQSVNLIAQGNDYKNRAGNSIAARNLMVNISAVANSTAGTNFLRFIIFQDLENTGSTPSAATLLESTGADIYLSHYNHILGNRFRVLADEHIILLNGQQAYYRRIVCPIDTDILYQGTGATAGDLYNGALFIAIVTDNATNGPTVAFDSRLTYVDN